jgi:rhodanese-related sulfurtransferase
MPKLIEREAVQDLLDNGGRLIEVLPEEQYRKVHIAGASNIPLGSLTPERINAFSTDMPLGVYCYDYQ